MPSFKRELARSAQYLIVEGLKGLKAGGSEMERPSGRFHQQAERDQPNCT
jgi:hypothetical protein